MLFSLERIQVRLDFVFATHRTAAFSHHPEPAKHQYPGLQRLQ
jgi:hypothetical protein